MDFQKKAVMSPTEANVREYYSIQDIARRKSLAFANVTAAVMQKHPELSLAKDYPTATPGRSALTRLEQDFDRRIREDHTVVPFTAAELRGVPPSVWRAARRDPMGRYLLGLDYPTAGPVLEKAQSAAARVT